MTLPIPSNVFADGELTNEAKWYTRIFQAINTIYSSAQAQPAGLVGFGTGPGIQTDYTTEATIAGTSIVVPVVNGRTYLTTAAIGTGPTQITATGVPTVRLKHAGVEVIRAVGVVTVGVGLGIFGTAVWYYTAVSTTNITFSMTCQDSAGAARLPANTAQIAVIDIGT